MSKTVLWWGRFDTNYSRNRVVRRVLEALDWRIREFHPVFSRLGDWEAAGRGIATPDLVWVPCFRQRDIAAARRWSARRGIPLLTDPLISAWDKQVFERARFSADSPRSQRLLQWESGLLQSADIVLADTPAHADFFARTLGVPQEKLHVVYVGAEKSLFKPLPVAPKPPGHPLDVLFFGSFIGLQGADTIVRAARLDHSGKIRWTLVGQGPEKARCQEIAHGTAHIQFADWMPYEKLPQRICEADVVLGIFGNSDKAGRVIPNKVFQALACGKNVITRDAEAYPEALSKSTGHGLVWVPPNNPEALLQAVAARVADHHPTKNLDYQAYTTYQQYFGANIITTQVAQALASV
jgi:glycosyltransferase involved in cell wall biosynthesis